MAAQPECTKCGVYVMHGPCLCETCGDKAISRIQELEAENKRLRAIEAEYVSLLPFLAVHGFAKFEPIDSVIVSTTNDEAINSAARRV